MKISRMRVERMMTNGLLDALGPLGFFELDTCVIVRPRGLLREGLFFQLSSPRSRQAICVTAGIDIPTATCSPQTLKSHFGATVGGRLSERGLGDGDLWIPAETLDDVNSAVHRVLSLLQENASWFEQFRNVRDVAEEYFVSRSLKPAGENDYWERDVIFHYACMLLAAGDRAGAIDWLRETDRVIRSGERLNKDDQTVLAQVAEILRSTTGSPS